MEDAGAGRGAGARFTISHLAMTRSRAWSRLLHAVVGEADQHVGLDGSVTVGGAPGRQQTEYVLRKAAKEAGRMKDGER